MIFKTFYVQEIRKEKVEVKERQEYIVANDFYPESNLRKNFFIKENELETWIPPSGCECELFFQLYFHRKLESVFNFNWNSSFVKLRGFFLKNHLKFTKNLIILIKLTSRNVRKSRIRELKLRFESEVPVFLDVRLLTKLLKLTNLMTITWNTLYNIFIRFDNIIIIVVIVIIFLFIIIIIFFPRF